MSEIKGLILNYLREEITTAERRELDAWLAESVDNQLLFDQINDPNWVAEALAKMDGLHEDKIWNRIQDRAGLRPDDQTESQVETLYPPARRKIGRYAAVAAAVLLITGSYLVFFNKKPAEIQKPPAVVSLQNDRAPGGSKAILTLANGRQIMLDSAQKGTLAAQNNMNIVKTDSGKLAYLATSEKPTGSVLNVLATPRGGQYQLTLPDGTEVWLNSASSIKYPTAFTGNQRAVEVTGEAYFEVARDKTKPFYVKVKEAEVAVLGTHFDIKAYDDEPNIKVTLLEGSVKVSSGTEHETLRPGQQARITDRINTIDGIDLDQVIAWKNGKFSFDNTDLMTILKEFSRWYDIKVVYEGKVPDRKFFGIMNRSGTLATVLSALQANNIRFELKGNTLTVK